MKANKVTVMVVVECLHIDGVSALVADAVRQIQGESINGYLTKEDGDTVTWNTEIKPVEF